MKTKFFIIMISVLFLFLSCNGEKTEIYGSNSGFLGILKNNELNIYKYSGKWIEMPDRNFTLGSGDQIDYFDAGYIVIKKKNALKFYTFNKGWTETAGGYKLPSGYKNVLYNQISHDIYLVKDKSIKAHKFIGRGWEEVPAGNILLPQKSSNIFLFSWLGNTSLSVDENGNLKFYDLTGNSLSETIASFSPPDEYKKIIPFFQSIGIVENQVIKFYEPSYDKYEDQKWLAIPDMDFYLE